MASSLQGILPATSHVCLTCAVKSILSRSFASVDWCRGLERLIASPGGFGFSLAPHLGGAREPLSLSLSLSQPRSLFRYKGSSKAQSMCIVYLAVEGEKEAREVYRSAVSRDDYSLKLQQKVKLPFRFSQQQNLIFNVYEAPSSDCDTPSAEQLIGSLETSLASVNKMGKVSR